MLASIWQTTRLGNKSIKIGSNASSFQENIGYIKQSKFSIVLVEWFDNSRS